MTKRLMLHGLRFKRKYDILEPRHFLLGTLISALHSLTTYLWLKLVHARIKGTLFLPQNGHYVPQPVYKALPDQSRRH